MCHRLGILRKYRTKNDLLIRITSHVAKPQNKKKVDEKLPKSILMKLFPHEYEEDSKDSATDDILPEEMKEEPPQSVDGNEVFDY
jgi:hypothetical protein